MFSLNEVNLAIDYTNVVHLLRQTKPESCISLRNDLTN